MQATSPLLRPRSNAGLITAVLAWTFLLTSNSRAQFDPEPVWIRRDPVNVNLNGVAYGLNRFIAVGNNGYWFTSPNGQTWTVRVPLTDGHLSAIHFAAGRFVAVGDGIYSSVNGVSWEKASLPYLRLALTDVTSDGADSWMVVGRAILQDGTPGNGLTFTSPDGVNWTRAAMGAVPVTIAFGAGKWFGAGGSGSPLEQWLEVESDPGSPPEHYWQTFIPDDFEAPQPTGRVIRFLNGRFVLCGFNYEDDPAGAHHVFTSIDGINWPKGSISNQGVPADGANQPRYSVMRDLAFGGGSYVGIAAGNPSPPADYWTRADAMTSTDGVNWTFIDRTTLGMATASRALTAITHADSQFVAVGYRGTTPFRNTIVTSPEGATWTSRSFNPRVFLRSANESAGALTTGDGLVVVVTPYGGAVVSPDRGVSWNYADVTAGGLGLEAVAHGGGRFVAGGQQGVAYRSTDGFSWSSVQVPDAFHLWDVIHDGTQFVAAGQYRNTGNTVQHGIVSRSTDGASWTTVQLPDTIRLDKIAFGNGVYVTLGVTQSPSVPTVKVSTDAIVWSAVPGAPALSRVAFGGGRFLGATGVEGNPQFYTSTDGADWTPIDAMAGLFVPPFFTAATLNFANGHFIMGGSELGIYFLDNDRWIPRDGPANAATTFIEDTYVATSLWTYRLPAPEPPLEPPVLTWRHLGDFLLLEFSTRLDHQYILWQRYGLGVGSQWTAVDSFVAQEEQGQFEVFMDLSEIEPQFYRISVEAPGGSF